MGLAARLGQVAPSSSDATASARLSGPALEQRARFSREVHERLVNRLGTQLYTGEIDPGALQESVFEAIKEVIALEDVPLSASDRARIVQEVVDDILGMGPLEPLLRDPEITEIMVNRYDLIYLERGGRIHPTSLRFSSERHLREIIDRIVSQVGRRVDESSPMVDARLADGSRVNAVIPPIALDGASLTIRKFSHDILSVEDLVSLGTLTESVVTVLRACVQGKLNILISGGTGSGKTTTLNVMSSFIPGDERIITIEDAAELRLEQEHVVRLEARPPNIEGAGAVTIRDLVRNSLRMRPDRIIVGEVRDAAALDMLQAMNTGHEGSMSTVHANSPRDALSRVETMVVMAGLELPMAVIREQVISAIDLVVHQMRLRDGSRHITQISQVVGVKDGAIRTRDLFAFDYSHDPSTGTMGTLRPTGKAPTFLDQLLDRGVELGPEHFQA